MKKTKEKEKYKKLERKIRKKERVQGKARK